MDVRSTVVRSRTRRSKDEEAHVFGNRVGGPAVDRRRACPNRWPGYEERGARYGPCQQDGRAQDCSWNESCDEGYGTRNQDGDSGYCSRYESGWTQDREGDEEGLSQDGYGH